MACECDPLPLAGGVSLLFAKFFFSGLEMTLTRRCPRQHTILLDERPQMEATVINKRCTKSEERDVCSSI